MNRRPNPLPRMVRWRSNVCQAPFLFLATGFFGTLALVASLFAKTGRTQHRIARDWARGFVFFSGYELLVPCLLHPPKYPVAVAPANSLSDKATRAVYL